MHFISTILAVAMTLGSALQDPYSNEWNKKSTLTADRRLELPGVVLEPGTYVIRLKEGSETRSLVEICNQDESQVIGTVLAVPDLAQRPDDSSEFTFFNVPQTSPEPVHTWFFSGDPIGLEFVYPKTRAKEIARLADAHVMASNSISKADVIVAVTPNGTEVVIDNPIKTAREKPKQ
jgi:hypothetical protein